MEGGRPENKRLKGWVGGWGWGGVHTKLLTKLQHSERHQHECRLPEKNMSVVKMTEKFRNVERQKAACSFA